MIKAPWHTNFQRARQSLDGYSFASQLEASLYGHLKILQSQGEVRDICVQVHLKLTKAEVLYICDFKAFDVKLGEDVYWEAKGFETPEWRIKRRLWTVYGPGRLRVFKGTARYLKMVEEIRPTLLD